MAEDRMAVLETVRKAIADGEVLCLADLVMSSRRVDVFFSRPC